MHIELYKKRSIGERFSVTFDFISQNGKVLFKNLLCIGIPLALLMGFFIQNYMVEAANQMAAPNPAYTLTPSYFGFMFLSALFSLFVYAMTGAILKKYQEGALNKNTGWADLKQDLFPIAGKIFLQGLICTLIIMIPAAILGAAIGFFGLLASLGNLAGLIIGVIALIVCVLMIIMLAPFILIPFPIFFENASAWQGIKKGLQLGFENLASTFLTFFLGVLSFLIIYYIFLMPYLAYFMLTNGAISVVGYLLAVIAALSMLVLYPILIVFFGFQYSSLVEKAQTND